MQNDKPVSMPTLTEPAKELAFNFRQRLSNLFRDDAQMIVFRLMTGYDAARIIAWASGTVAIPQHAWTILRLLEVTKVAGVMWPRDLVE